MVFFAERVNSNNESFHYLFLEIISSYSWEYTHNPWVELIGLEPTTNRLKGGYSFQLSYSSIAKSTNQYLNISCRIGILAKKHKIQLTMNIKTKAKIIWCLFISLSFHCADSGHERTRTSNFLCVGQILWPNWVTRPNKLIVELASTKNLL